MADAPRGRQLRPKFNAETLSRHSKIAVTYNKMTTIQHNKEMRALNRKILLKQEAIMGLPESLRASAMEIDEAPMPVSRPIPMWTPPIKGFNPNDYASKF
mmetsp:Transcript_19493/g.33762  ORF Transcript_19493/g.33762 Transcript_19493/m.33762 type:complete len:100 (+) Transcript_19493:1-300(+)